MFATMLLAAWTLLHAYVFWRLSTVPFVARRVPRRILVAVAAILWASFFLVRLVAHDSADPFARGIELVSMNWLAMLFLLAVALLVAEVATGFGFLVPRRAPAIRGWALVAGGAMCVAALVQGMRAPVVTASEVRLAGLPAGLDGTVIVAVSDLHLGSLLDDRWLAARVTEIEAERPDLVVFLGDLFEGHGQSAGDPLPVLRRVRAPLGVWAVAGNHESHGGRDTGLRLLETAGFQVLRDRWTEVRPGLIVAGVDDLTSRRRTGDDAGAVDRALAGRPPGATVLLSHSPLQAERAAASGVGLMLAGHTHAGQVWPFGEIVRFVYPLLAGRYEVDGMTAIVCRGTGTWGPRMRLWQPGEILRVTLRAGTRPGAT